MWRKELGVKHNGCGVLCAHNGYVVTQGPYFQPNILKDNFNFQGFHA